MNCFRLTLLALALSAPLSVSAAPPNIVYILCDDLGYGDVHCLNPQGKIATPNIDRLAAAGMRFTDAHSGSSVCTPTRYGVITGRYSWRTKLKQGVLLGYSPLLIEPGRMTVASLVKRHGYTTAAIGKWHLGIGHEKTDYDKPLAPGANAVGFDSYFGIAASLDMVPYVFIKNEAITAPLTETAVDSPAPPFWRAGSQAAGFRHEDVLPRFEQEAVNFISQQSADRPFFLYLPLASPHTPIVPTSSWRGKSGLNAYGDFVMQTDATIGAVLAALDKGGLADNTLVVVTSDNGCAPMADIEELIAKGHNPSYHFRGHKADIYDGGHRLPFIVRWPGRVQPGSSSDQTICHTDLLATCADILGEKLPDNAGEDSVSILPALEGRADGPLHEAVVHHSAAGAFAIRQGRWKLCFCPGSGGWSYPRPRKDDTSKLPPMQLFDMQADVGERNNVIADYPDVVARLTALLKKYVADGRSTPGKPQANEGVTNIRKGITDAEQPKPKRTPSAS